MQNKLLTVALGGILAFGATSAVHAQDNPAAPPQQQGEWRGHGRMDPDAQLQHMTRQLGLTSDQQNQIKPILADRQQKVQAVFQDQTLARQDRRAKMQSIREDSDSRIEAVLNDQQKQNFEAMHERMEGRGEGTAAHGDANQAPPSTSQPQ